MALRTYLEGSSSYKELSISTPMAMMVAVRANSHSQGSETDGVSGGDVRQGNSAPAERLPHSSLALSATYLGQTEISEELSH
jgi:hypothetical protein